MPLARSWVATLWMMSLALGGPARPVSALAGAAGPRRDSTGFSREYGALREAIDRYRDLAAAGGWPGISDGPRLTPGARDDRVPTLRRRLAAEGYLVEHPGRDSGVYDGDVEAAVRRFQELHGLEADGVLGPGTRTALNVPSTARLRQLAANLGRLRRLPGSLGDRYVLVNIPAFSLEVIEGGNRVMQLRTIVGRRDWPTPVLSSHITDLVFRPVWTIPRSIALSEVLPMLRRDSGYLARDSIRVFGDSGAEDVEVDGASIDWPAVSESTFTWQLVQEPGPANPLGGVKLDFRNSFGVYLHDTPARALFDRSRRTLSHGCVRVEHVEELVAWLLPEWPADSIAAAMKEGRERRVRLSAPVPVYIVYWTAWTAEDGMVAFRDDVYGLGGRLGPVPRR